MTPSLFVDRRLSIVRARPSPVVRLPSSVTAGWLAILLLVLPASLQGHEGGSVAGLWSGLLHPITGLDHVLAMIAVGLWGSQMGNPALWVLPVVFPMVMAFGGMLALIGLPLPGVEIGIVRWQPMVGIFTYIRGIRYRFVLSCLNR